MDLNQFQTRVLSQWGQDGVLEQIFNLIGTTNKYFVEFGSSGNDEGMGNTAYLRRRGFDGLLMDGSENPYGNHTNKKYDVKIEFIKSSNINELFRKYNVPEEFDFLSIDIDGQDFHVWNNLDSKYKPRVVSIEMCYHILPGIDRVMVLNDNWVWPGNHLSGASITALKKLGNKKGYSLVATCMSDAIFVRNDLIYDKDNNVLFKNINNEHELTRLNTDLEKENSKYIITMDMYDIPLFTSSDAYL